MTEKMQKKSIEYYQNSELYTYIDSSNKFMLLAKLAALEESLTPVFPIGIVIVKNNKIIAKGANGNGYHEKHLNSKFHKKGCKRRYKSQKLEEAGKPKLLSGEGFELCPGCNYDCHAEIRTINKIRDKSILKNSSVYMYGHWWSCSECWQKMKNVGIKKVYVVKLFKDKKNLIAWRNEFDKIKYNNR